MTADHVLSASTIVTMDPARPRATSVALDTAAGTIVAVGTLDECRAAAPGARETDLGAAVLAPGLIEPHGHPFVSGVATQPPAIWIAPYVGYPSWNDVQALFRRCQTEQPPGVPLLFNGLDRLLQQAPEPDIELLDGFFPDRPVAVLDNSGHMAFFNTATAKLLGWEAAPPPDPVGAAFGRHADGTPDGRASELAAVMAVIQPLMAQVVTHPLHSAAQFYALMARGGITTTSDMTYSSAYLKGYEALASMPDCPLRVSLYHMSTEPDADEPLVSAVPEVLLRKQGIKLWADGSPWVGSAALTYPYLDTETVRTAGIPLGPSGTTTMNYSLEQLQDILARYVPSGWQMAFHVNGDAGLDVVLAAYQQVLERFGLLGSDHRWRVEHVGGARAEQFDRIADLGLYPSMSPFQFIYWGDLLDGTLFAPEIGSQWQRFGDAERAGTCLSFHNDGSVTPPLPLLNIQAAITRRTPSGTLHGPEQRIGLEQALAAHTVNAARTLRREHEIGSIEPGKLADFVELSADPHQVDPTAFIDQVAVLGTWRGGRRIDLGAFLAQVEAVDPSGHAHLAVPGHAC
ncbi:amidohydrolase [Nakamurella leprariae]|uniref:Amidohydrolase n=1 Tax=Nakamurella leprariae TaxID=2803911 RepID=A0A939BYF2_9ACTN|nr:amidohydrolase [Nakamurella leprariae]MBM9469493.1 amidohydrolase [Nakamurella leprariae]